MEKNLLISGCMKCGNISKYKKSYLKVINPEDKSSGCPCDLKVIRTENSVLIGDLRVNLT